VCVCVCVCVRACVRAMHRPFCALRNSVPSKMEKAGATGQPDEHHAFEGNGLDEESHAQPSSRYMYA
jgi:hypothetical protein